MKSAASQITVPVILLAAGDLPAGKKPQ